VQVTEENFEQVAKWTKGKICYTDPKIAEKFKKPVQKWIEIEVKNPLNDRQTKAFVGDYVLSANNGFKIYTAGAFAKNFDPAPKPQAPKIGKVHEETKLPKIHMDQGDKTVDLVDKNGQKVGEVAGVKNNVLVIQSELSSEEIARLEHITEESQS
jgi:hypothetical protein